MINKGSLFRLQSAFDIENFVDLKEIDVSLEIPNMRFIISANVDLPEPVTHLVKNIGCVSVSDANRQ